MKKTFDPSAYANHVAKELILNFEGAGLGTTSELVGDSREQPVKEKLEQILPTGIAVGSGCIIDSYGNTTKQMDIVLYEKDICPVYCINNAPETTYYPCEGVVAIGEVKSYLNTKELKDIFAKIESVKKLKRFSEESSGERLVGTVSIPYRCYGTTAEQNVGFKAGYSQEDYPCDQIFGFAVAGKLKLKPETLCEKFVELVNEKELTLTPNLIVMLNGGILCPLVDSDEKYVISMSFQDATKVYHADKGNENFRFLLSMIHDVYYGGRTVPVSAFVRYLDLEGVLTLPGDGICVSIER